MADADFNVKAIISAQTSQFEKGIKNAQSSVNSLSSSISNITNLVKKAFAFTGVVVGTKAIVDFGKSCVQSATEAVKTFNILDNTVRATGADAWTSTKELESASKALSDSTNYSVTEIQKMQSVLLGFTNITGEAFDGASEAVLDMATVMGMDLTSAVQTVGKALDDPITGLDSLRRQGFKFTDEQKAELAQLVKNGKQLEAQKIILDTLAISYGGASKAGQDSFAKQRHAVENFSDAFGTKLIPVMKVFAENNAKMINSLRELIENMDFTPVVNVVTNLSKIFAETFNTISGYLRNVGDYVSDFISRFNFKPIISVLDGLLGGLSEIISKFKEMNSQKLEIFDKLKESLIDFSNSETFQNIVNFVNKIIDAVFFLWSEMQDVVAEIRNLIVNKIIEIWNKIKELFQNGQNALSESGQDIASWGDLFYNILNNAFRSFQDFFGMIKALIHGDWTVAWEYAKLTVMRVADNILDLISTIANAFPNLINGMIEELNKLITEINKVRGWFGKDPLGLISAFESVDLSKKSGLEDKIKETENKIQELTGKSADITIQNLEGVSTKFAGFTQHVLGEIGKLTEGVGQETEKQKEYFSSATSDSENSYKAFSEWDSKLLKQRQDNLSEYSKEYHEINIQLIEQERKKALENAKTEEERAKINKYYNNEIEEENERFNKARREQIASLIKYYISQISSIASKTGEVFKKVANTIKNAFSKITSIVKSVKDIFTKLFEFNIDDALTALLKVEDAILTFFVETLPRLPSFFESAFASVLRTIKSLIDYIDWGKVAEFLTSIINTFVNYAPEIVSGIVEIFTNLVITISNVLVENAPQIVSALGQMFFTIIEALPALIENFINVIGTFISEIGRYITENGERLAQDLSNIVHSIVEGITNFIKNGGWKNLLNALLTIQKAIEKAVMDNIDDLVDSIIEALPDLINMLIESIVSASKTLAKLIKPILKLIIELIKALIQVAFSDEVLDASIEVVQALIEALLEIFIKELPRSLPKIITKIIGFIIKSLPKMVNAIIKALVNILINTNWGEVFYEVIVGIGESFGEVGETLKDIFEDAFNTIGELLNTLWQGTFANPWLWHVLNGMADEVKKSFEGIGEFFNGIWNNLTSGAEWAGKELKNGFEWAINGIKGFFEGLGTKVQEIFEQIGNGIKWAINGIIWTVNQVIAGINSVVGWTGIRINQIGYLAKGTNNAQKGLYLVGEAGPELVQFNGGERVLNNRNTNKALSEMGSNSGNTFNVIFNNLQDTTAFAMMNQLKQYKRQMAINSII